MSKKQIVHLCGSEKNHQLKKSPLVIRNNAASTGAAASVSVCHWRSSITNLLPHHLLTCTLVIFMTASSSLLLPFIPVANAAPSSSSGMHSKYNLNISQISILLSLSSFSFFTSFFNYNERCRQKKSIRNFFFFFFLTSSAAAVNHTLFTFCVSMCGPRHNLSLPFFFYLFLLLLLLANSDLFSSCHQSTNSPARVGREKSQPLCHI